MRPKVRERREARRLRRQHGMPVKQIASRLGVSAGSVSVWVRDIQLTKDQRRRNMSRARRVRGDTWREVNRARRRTFQAEGRARARVGEPLHLAGCMLYWAEGSKDRNIAILANSDLHMMRFYCRFLKECFRLNGEDLSVRLNVYTGNGLSIRRIDDHWLSALGLPRSCLRKHSLNHFPTSSSGQRRAKLPYGVCTVKVKRSTWLVQHIFGAIQEYAGFDEPRWLDGPPIKRRKREQPATSPG